MYNSCEGDSIKTIKLQKRGLKPAQSAPPARSSDAKQSSPIKTIQKSPPAALNGGVPSTLLHAEVTSVSGYLDAIAQIEPKSVSPLWFRGISKVSHTLLPTIYRNAAGKTEDHLRKMEERLNRRFRDRSMPYSPQARDESSDAAVVHSWWRLFTMQHYGAPTRLLDWSENALTALCFAVFGAAVESPCTQDAAVWVLDPSMWNKIGNSNHESALSVDEHGAGPYSPLPSLHQHVSTNWPLAIFGMHNSPRIVTQQGTFVIFSPGKFKSMEDHAIEVTSKGHPAILRAITIKKQHISDIASALRKLGFVHSSLYPDLYGLSTDLKKEFGY